MLRRSRGSLLFVRYIYIRTCLFLDRTIAFLNTLRVLIPNLTIPISNRTTNEIPEIRPKLIGKDRRLVYGSCR